MSTTLVSLLPDVLGRVEETNPPIFWNLAGEVYVQMVYALFEAAVVTGNVQTTGVPTTITANTTYFPVPKGMIAPIRMRAPFPVRKTSLKSLDDNTPNWQQAAPKTQIQKWFPLGVNLFGIYPQLSSSAIVTMDYISSPVNEFRPYTGNEASPFQKEFNDVLTTYAAAMLRNKEGGVEAEESESVFKDYMRAMKTLSQFQQRVDSLVYSGAYGLREGVNPRTVV